MKGWSAVVTGASRGLGREIALALAEEGAKVALICRENYAQARDVAGGIGEKGGAAWAFQCDVRDSAAVGRTFEEIFQVAGSIEVLVNNAGISHASLLLRTDERTWDEMISTNLTGAFNCMRAVIPFMLRNGRGRIVNIGSLSGMRGMAGAAAYCASKAGLIGLTLSAAREYGRKNISVNAILPGYAPSDMGEAIPSSSVEEIFLDNVLGRGSTMKEVAAFVVRLVQMEGVSGQVFNLDSRPWR